ncbi:MAG: agmatinase [Deltaproteobacteria bacterium]|nr:agmatinase [Deltaproteobacteria bacterium]
MNYGGIDSHSSLADAKFVVVPVPYDLTSTYQSGSRRGPGAILDASANMELYDEELRQETYLAGIHTLVPLAADARGPEEMVASVREQITRVLVHGKIPVMLGGEHSISLGAVQAMQEKYPALSVLQLDAHADLRDSYQGSPYSHAAVARRIVEICPLVQVGIRSMSVEEAVFMAAGTVRTLTVDAIRADKSWQEKVLEYLSGDVYVTIDLDVFDPAIMPSTGTPEPDGLAWRDVISLLRELSRRRRIRGFDVVELAPVPGLVAPDFLAAKLVYRLMGYLTPDTVNI